MRQRAETPTKNKIFAQRLMWLQVFFLISVAIFVIYLFAMQVMDARHYRVKAKNQRRASTFVMRGDIYDRNGIKLATDTAYYDIYVKKDDMDNNTPEDLARKLAPILKISQVNLLAKINQDGPLISLKKNVDRHTRDKIASLNLREVPMDKKSIRTYPQGTLAAHVLGYYNFDADLAAGVESTARDKLETVTKGA